MNEPRNVEAVARDLLQAWDDAEEHDATSGVGAPCGPGPATYFHDELRTWAAEIAAHARREERREALEGVADYLHGLDPGDYDNRETRWDDLRVDILAALAPPEGGGETPCCPCASPGEPDQVLVGHPEAVDDVCSCSCHVAHFTKPPEGEGEPKLVGEIPPLDIVSRGEWSPGLEKARHESEGETCPTCGSDPGHPEKSPTCPDCDPNPEADDE